MSRAAITGLGSDPGSHFDSGIRQSLFDLAYVEVLVDSFHTIRQTGIEGEDVSLEHAVEQPDGRLAVLEDEVVVLWVTTKPSAS